MHHGRGHVLLLLLLESFLVHPTPFFFEFFVQETHAPSGFFADFVQDLKDFFLFAAGYQTFSCYGQGAEGDACNSPTFDQSGILGAVE